MTSYENDPVNKFPKKTIYSFFKQEKNIRISPLTAHRCLSSS